MILSLNESLIMLWPARVSTYKINLLGIIGGRSLSPAGQTKLSNLAAMLNDDGDFELAFEQNHKEEKPTTKLKNGKHHDHIENLL